MLTSVYDWFFGVFFLFFSFFSHLRLSFVVLLIKRRHHHAIAIHTGTHYTAIGNVMLATLAAEHWRQPRRGCRGHIPQYFGLGGTSAGISTPYYYVLLDIADQYWLPSVRSASSRFH